MAAWASKAQSQVIRPMAEGALVVVPTDCKFAGTMTIVLGLRESPGLCIPGGAPLSTERSLLSRRLLKHVAA